MLVSVLYLLTFLDARLTKFHEFLFSNNLILGDLKVYDRVDLKLLLKKAGFKNVVDRNFVKTYILQPIEKGTFLLLLSYSNLSYPLLSFPLIIRILY